jgi:predicted alpha/beta hydrolase family esterase
MKTAAIFHSAGSRGDSFWYPYAKRALECQGYDVFAPDLPDADAPTLAAWLAVALEGKYTDESILIGHSAGCPLILALLERLETPVQQAVLVAGFARANKYVPMAMLKDKYDWELIRRNVKELIFINSDNDPFGCDDEMGRYMFDQLGGTFIVRHGEGHMGSDSYNQPYKEFPLLARLIS